MQQEFVFVIKYQKWLRNLELKQLKQLRAANVISAEIKLQYKDNTA
jgi:hypothetical protein